MLSQFDKSGQSVASSSEASSSESFLSDESYQMNHGRRGLALIFNHFRFDAKLNLSDRSGTEVDKDKLKLSLFRLGFDVQATQKMQCHPVLFPNPPD